MENKFSLYLMDDNHNSFEHVIYSLVNCLNIDRYHAEQIATIVHHKGECCIKTGDFNTITEIFSVLNELNLTLKIIEQ